MQTPSRLNISPRARLLFGVVAFAGIGLLIAIIVLLNSSLGLIAAKTNEIDARRARESVQSALDTGINTISAVMTDNAVWDDATQKTYAAHMDMDWMYGTWGNVATDDHAYDGVYVLDENYRVLWGYADDKPVTGSAEAIFGRAFPAIVGLHQLDLKNGEPAIGWSRTPSGPSLVGINLIRPTSGPLRATNGQKRYLVMTRHVTASTLQTMSRTFRLEGLHLIATVPATGAYVPLRAADGQVMGALVWTLHPPGAEAARAVRPDVMRIMWLTGGLIVFFVAVAGYGLLQLARSERVARNTALTDGLSGLPNRRALLEKLQKGRTASEPRSVIFIDLDGFKDINDIYGHETGDKLIVIVAEALKARVPRGAMLARMGGDEFALLIWGSGCHAAADMFAGEAVKMLNAPIHIGERTIQVGASIGIAGADDEATASQELFRRADMAMYVSKAQGKGRVTRYDRQLDAVRQHKQGIESGIREGIDRGEFEVFYQPIVDSHTLRVVSVEALVRWPGRPEGALMPDDFIPIAETSGLIHPLGLFVLRRACRDLCPVAGMKLSVNVSPAQFRDPDFESKVAAVLAETGFPASRLELEVTEGYLIENPERAVSAIAALKALGISIALDDFGTGYSSIGYLRRYGFDKIKIDKSLASLVDTDPQAAALVAGTVSIARALNISVTAEGVETEDHASLLRLAGCHTQQGYLYSRPKPLAEIMALACFPAQAAA